MHMKTKLRIGALDSAMVFRADGTVEVLMPHLGSHREQAPTAVKVGALLWAYSNEKAMCAIAAAMEAEADGGSSTVPS
jgi:hypothetical protein